MAAESHALVELGERHVARGDRRAATACLREAGTLEVDEPRIARALERLSATG